MRKPIDTAPRNGDFVFLEDAARGTVAFARWSAEAAQWLNEDGTPTQLNATHWHSLQNLDEEGTPSQLNAAYWNPLTPAQSVSEKADEAGSLTGSTKPSAWRIHRGASRPASGGKTAQLQRAAKPGRSVNVWTRFIGFAGRGGGKVPSAFAVAGGWIVAMAACLLVGAAFGPLLYSGDLGKSLLHWTASEDDTGLQQALQQERERASKLAGDVAAAQREVESQTTLIRQAGEASGREKAASERTLVELRQALQLELAKTDRLAGQLAEAQRDNAAQTALTGKTIAERERVIGELRQALKQQEDKPAQANIRTAEQLDLKQEREKAEKLRVELAAARREAESQAALLRSASDEATRLKEASARTTDELRQARRQGDKAEKLAGELAAARQEVEAQTTVARAASEEARQAAVTSKRSTDEQGQALREAQGNAEKLTAELAAARQEVQAQTVAARAARDEAARQAAETNKRSTDEQGQALREAQGHAEKLTAELAAARQEVQAQTAAARAARDEAARQAAETNKRSTDEQGQALREAQGHAEKLTAELAAARQEVQAQTAAARAARDEAARQAAETNKRSTDEQGQALREAQGQAEKLTAELAAARQEVEAQTAAARAAPEAARQVAETSKRSADDQGQALREAQGQAEKLTAELAAARQEVEAQTAVARAASDEARRVAEASKRSAEEQNQALREAQGKAENLVIELAAARREVQSQVSVASAAKDEAAGVKEATERIADEQRRALQQERDKTEKLTAELAEARLSLEAQTRAKAADDVARDNLLAAVRGELQKAKAEATVALESLVAERTRTQRVEQQLASIQASTAPRDRRSPAAASSTVGQLTIAASSVPEAPPKAPTEVVQQPTNMATRPTTNLEQGSPQAVRLIARANLLLDQGNIGAARNMLDRAAEMGSTEALFWLAETYDPLLLSARKTFGTQSDIAKARELYGKALAGGVSQAKARLDALQQ